MDDLNSELGAIDVCFVIDVTGSMQPYIDEARTRAREEARRIAESGDLDLRFAVVAYRDHPPQDTSFVTRVYPFGDDAAFQAALTDLVADGGGDGPEAVLDGLWQTASLQWRPTADRVCFLIGDAPPHGAGVQSQWPEGCPCRATPGGIIELFRGNRITLHAIALGQFGYPKTAEAFRELAEGTGGNFFQAVRPADATASITHVHVERSSMVSAARSWTTALRETGGDYYAALASSGFTPEMATGTEAYLHARRIGEDVGDTPVAHTQPGSTVPSGLGIGTAIIEEA